MEGLTRGMGVSTRSQTQRVPARQQKNVESVSSHPEKGSSGSALQNKKAKSRASKIGGKWTSSDRAIGSAKAEGPGQKRAEV